MHAIIISGDHGVSIRDYESTNGVYVNDRKTQEAILKSGDLIYIGDTLLKFLQGPDPDGLHNELIYYIYTHDALTDLYNKRHLQEVLEHETLAARRHARHLALAVLTTEPRTVHAPDPDRRTPKDLVLRAVARTIRECIGDIGIASRPDDESFVLVYPGFDSSQVVQVMNELCGILGSLELAFDEHQLRVTPAYGVAELGPEIPGPEDLLRHAHQAREAGSAIAPDPP